MVPDDPGLIEKAGGAEQVAAEAQRDMWIFDTLPKVLQKVVDDTGVDYVHVEAWLRHFINAEPNILKRGSLAHQEWAANAAAAKIRELMVMAHEQRLVEDAAALEAHFRRSAKATRRRP